MLVSDFDYHLPGRLIAQEPSARRDRSRLLVVDRASGAITDSIFEHLPDYLRAGDLLVVNNTRVFPAWLIGRRLRTAAQGETILGGRVEVFLVRRIEPLLWEALVRPGRSFHPGARIEFAQGKLIAEVIERREMGRRVIRFEAGGNLDEIIDEVGRTPLPPYIKRDEEDRLDSERYQTVYARERGAVAAPTAGLHFTPELLSQLRGQGIEIVEITLHVGYGTFQPVRVERIADHRIEPEAYTISEAAADAINRALDKNRRVIAVGTTTTRALESASLAATRRRGDAETRGQSLSLGQSHKVTDSDSPRRRVAASPRPSITDLFIYPGFKFQVISGLITNFHLPRSSLLMLVSAHAGRELVLKAYRHAVEREYRFYSYGDAMLIL